MVWKCPKCKYTSEDYGVMRRHFYGKHPSKKKAEAVSKGKQKKTFVFKPLKPKK